MRLFGTTIECDARNVTSIMLRKEGTAKPLLTSLPNEETTNGTSKVQRKAAAAKPVNVA